MGLRLTFLQLKKGDKEKAIGCQFLPLISVALFWVLFKIVQIAGFFN
jgi:hypothetical protein